MTGLPPFQFSSLFSLGPARESQTCSQTNHRRYPASSELISGFCVPAPSGHTWSFLILFTLKFTYFPSCLWVFAKHKWRWCVYFSICILCIFSDIWVLPPSQSEGSSTNICWLMEEGISFPVYSRGQNQEQRIEILAEEFLSHHRSPAMKWTSPFACAEWCLCRLHNAKLRMWVVALVIELKSLTESIQHRWYFLGARRWERADISLGAHFPCSEPCFEVLGLQCEQDRNVPVFLELTF